MKKNNKNKKIKRGTPFFIPLAFGFSIFMFFTPTFPCSLVSP